MSFLALLRIALRALAVNKLRSALTMLGIVIGVGAVIVMIAVGAGAQARVEEQIRALGSNLLLVMPGSTTAGGVRMGFGSGSTLTEDDVVAINREIPEALAAPALRGSAQVIWGNANWSTQIFGVTPEYLDVRQWPLVAGRTFEPAEMAGAAKVALIGATVAKQLFGAADPLDQSIRIKRVPFTIIGVLDSKGQSLMGTDQDDLILVPIKTARSRVLGTSTRSSWSVPIRLCPLTSSTPTTVNGTRLMRITWSSGSALPNSSRATVAPSRHTLPALDISAALKLRPAASGHSRTWRYSGVVP